MAKDLLPPILWPYSGCAGNAINGLQIFLLGAIVFATVATFAVRPYYHGHRGYGSSPLAVRTGLMALRKLNVIHRWLSYICFALSVVHTVPFIVAPLKDGGPRALHKQYYKTGAFEVLPSTLE
jgi:hypothetical protein